MRETCLHCAHADFRDAAEWAESGEQEAMRSEVEAEAANLAAAESAWRQSLPH